MAAAAESLLATIADRHYGEDRGGFHRKPESFIAEYERLFAAIRLEPLRVLELGVFFGMSLLMWRDYFPNAIIVGVDVREKPPSIDEQPRIHYVKGSQDDPETLEGAAAVAGRPFDIIIDDASHIGYLTRRSLFYLFPRWLRPGGTYVIEDLGAAFMDAFPDGSPFQSDESDDPQVKCFPSHQHGILGVVKQVIDQTMKGMVTGVPSVLDVERMTFLPNIAVIRKAPAPPG